MSASVYDEALRAVMEQDQDLAMDQVKKHLDSGENPMLLMEKGFVPGINKIGDLFSAGKVFLPELMMAADVMSQASEALMAALPADHKAEGPAIIITAGTVKGDIHDIGKGIGIAMFRANGFTVHDMGRDVPVDKLIDNAVKNNSNVIATSALLTTTLNEQKLLEEALKKADLKGRIKTMVAGAPVTPRWASRIGADVYAENAHEGVVGVRKAFK